MKVQYCNYGLFGSELALKYCFFRCRQTKPCEQIVQSIESEFHEKNNQKQKQVTMCGEDGEGVGLLHWSTKPDLEGRDYWERDCWNTEPEHDRPTIS